MKVITLTLILALVGFNMQGQINFTKVPLDNQLVGRNLSTNTGQIIIEGNVNSDSVSYQNIRIDIFRENILLNDTSASLNYINSIADFNFNISIPAELANYSLKIYGEENGGNRTLEKEILNIVAGDVYIIQGQSNAEARQFNGNANVYQNDFIRVYAGGYNNSSSLLANEKWAIAQGNGGRNTLGNVGQWGLKLANTIVSSTNIPIAIFNGADGGRPIKFFLAPTDYQTSLSSNYGKMYYRINQTNLTNYVRAVFWCQGERDSAPPEKTTLDEYKSRFNQLKSSWFIDYFNAEHIYVFQTKNSCGWPLENLMRIKEAQRQLAEENSDVSIIPTAAMTLHTDSCHFPFVNGYEIFADRLSPIILRDLYNTPNLLDIDAPMITDAYLTDNNKFTIETDASTNLEISTIAEDFELHSDNNATINDIRVSGSNIIITSSVDISASNPKISYIAPQEGRISENFITNSNGLEIICFDRYPVNTKTLSLKTFSNSQNIRLFPNPSKETIQVLGLNTAESFKVYDVLGAQINNWNISNNDTINIENLTTGVYFLKFENGNTIKFIKE